MNGLFATVWPFSDVLVERLGWVLVHSLWQFLLVALVAAVVMRAMRGSSSATRYGVLVIALVLSVSMPFVTYTLQPRETFAPPVIPGVVNSGRIATAAPEDIVAPIPLSGPSVVTRKSPARQPAGDVAIATTVSRAPLTREAHAQPALSWSESLNSLLRPWLAWIVTGWSVGVVLCCMRPLLGWHTLSRLRRIGVSPVSPEVVAKMQDLARRLGVRRVVRVMHSTLAQVPVVVGYLRPIILLPLSLMTNIPASQLEAILAHELAHVRRHDFIVNLLQTLIETLFFYHPAVWWLSRQIRVEREHCCDDLVVTLLGNRVEYGRALLAVEELRGQSSLLALGAADGSLLSRIRRIVRSSSDPARDSAWSIPGRISCGVVILLGFATLGVCWSMDWSRDRAQTTVVVEWSVLVDTTVAQEILGPVFSTEQVVLNPNARKFDYSADALRNIIRRRLDEPEIVRAQTDSKPILKLPGLIRYFPPTESAFRRHGDSIVVSDSEVIRVGGGLKGAPDDWRNVNWVGDGLAMFSQRADGMRIKFDSKYHARLQESGPKYADVEAHLAFQETLKPGRATAVLLTPPVRDEYRPSLMIVYETIQLPTAHLDILKSMTRAEDWVRRGATGMKEHVARLAQWHSRQSRDAYQLDPTWTRTLSHGGHVQLVGLGRRIGNKVTWWSPHGDPLSVEGRDFDVSGANLELMAIVRVWETGTSRIPTGRSLDEPGFGGLPDKFQKASGTQLMIVPAVFDPQTSQGTLKIGAGFGPWTAETTIGSQRDSTATFNNVQFRTAAAHDLKHLGITSTAFYWQPVRDFEFTTMAIGRSGQRVSSTSLPMVYANDPPNTVNHGNFYNHKLPKAEIDSYLLKSRPIQWAEFDGFAVEPGAGLATLDPDAKAHPYRAELADGTSVELLGITADTTDSDRWWAPDGTGLGVAPLDIGMRFEPSSNINQRRFAIRTVGTDRASFSFAGDGQYRAVARAAPLGLWYETIVAPTAFAALDPTTVTCAIGEKEFGPWAIIDRTTLQRRPVDIPPELSGHYAAIVPTGVETVGDKTHLNLQAATVYDCRLAARLQWVAVAKDRRRSPAIDANPLKPARVRFEMPAADIDHFEFRIQPHRYWVTFENVALKPGQKTKVKVTIGSPPQPKPNTKSNDETAARKVLSENNWTVTQLPLIPGENVSGLLSLRNPPTAAWEHVGRLTGITEVDVVAQDLRGEPLRQIARMGGLAELRVLNSPFLPADLATFTGHPSLEKLDVMLTTYDALAIQEERAKLVQDFTAEQLTWIKNEDARLLAKSGGKSRRHALEAMVLTDRALQALSGVPHLRRLKLVNTDCSRRCLAVLQKLPELESLELSIHDEPTELPKLGNFPRLHHIGGNVGINIVAEIAAVAKLDDVEVREITDESVPELLKITGLKRLCMKSYTLSDAGLLKLAELPELTELVLETSRGKLTQAGVAKFRGLKPNCVVQGDQKLPTGNAENTPATGELDTD